MRRAQKQGHVFLRGKKGGGTWIGRWRTTEFGGPEGLSLIRVRQSVGLGTKDEVPTKELAMEKLEVQMARVSRQQEITEQIRRERDKRRTKPKPQSPYAAYISRAFAIRKKYGLTHDDIDNMIKDQCGRCALCSDPCPNLVVDHCHVTNANRALLCGHCNTGLGMFRDRPDLLRLAADYIESHNHNQ
jgi:ferredoxin